MIRKWTRYFLLLVLPYIPICAFAQNVGIGAPIPSGKLHIKGSADISQFVIDAGSTQSNVNPLIRLRTGTGTDLMWIHSDHTENIFIGQHAGRINNAIGNAVYNTFIGKDAGYFNTVACCNTAIGAHALYSNFEGIHNTANGLDALYANTTGSSNTGIGSNALFSNTIGSENTAIGKSSLFQNTTAAQNTAVGFQALYSQSFNPGNAWNSGNVAIGYQSLFSNQPNTISSGNKNTAIGTSAMYSNAVGFRNSAVGYNALYSNTLGSNNSAIGTEAMYSNTIGSANTAQGDRALFSNTWAGHNIAIGYKALFSQSYNPGSSWDSDNVAIGYEAMHYNQPTSSSNGIYNTAIGTSALHENTIGSANTAIGTYALFSNTSADQNTAIGNQSLYENSTGRENTAIGAEALYSNETGNANVALGFEALRDNINGFANTACGRRALLENTIGDANCAFGSDALSSNEEGSFNVAVGDDALLLNTTGSYNTAVGTNTGAGNSLDNTTTLGYNANASASNRIEIGNTSISWIGGEVGWSTYSDGRIKDDIRHDVPGLDFITRLQPVTYNLNIHCQNELVYTDERMEGNWPSKYDIEKIRMTGFIAQEVEQAALEAGYNFSGIEKPQSPDELYSLRYADFVMPLVKAVQEQQAIIESQYQKIISLEGRLASIEAKAKAEAEVKEYAIAVGENR